MTARRGLTIVLPILAVIAVVSATLAAGTAADADGTGTALYTPTSGTEANAYARVIQLQHSGSANGQLLATFEHWNTDGSPAQLTIRQSTDGQSWRDLATVGDPLTGAGHPVSQMWQPFLYEFPQQLGSYPAGTLLLVANMVPADGSYTLFYEWRSTDHGATWNPVGTVQQGGTFGSGIWEPFLGMDASGQLLMYFSDERDSPQHSQMLVHIASTDGGDSWGPVVRDVASDVSGDRPGMASVARMGDGRYVMSYEVCGQTNCPVHYKFSSDGDSWNATDLGQEAVTTDGRYLGGSPYVVWDPAINGLVLSGHGVYQTSNDQVSGENMRAVFVNTNGGQGSWSWAPAPWQVSGASSACNANYSPNLLVESGGTVRYTAPTSVDSRGPCGESTGTAPIAVLPYQSAFDTAGDAGWADYGGCWSVDADVYQTTCGGDVGAKALTGSTGWTDYTMAADVEVTSASGDAGVLAHVSNPAVGTDSHNGYTAFFDVAAGTLTIARQDGGYTALASAPVSGGLQANTWYRITFTVQGSSLTAALQTPDGQTTTVSATDQSFPAGMVGLRDHAGTAAYRNVTVSAT